MQKNLCFQVPIGLKHHLLLHTGELPFLCLHCWRSFSSHIDLKLHIRKEHLFHLAESQAAAQQALLEKRRVKYTQFLTRGFQSLHKPRGFLFLYPGGQNVCSLQKPAASTSAAAAHDATTAKTPRGNQSQPRLVERHTTHQVIN